MDILKGLVTAGLFYGTIALIIVAVITIFNSFQAQSQAIRNSPVTTAPATVIAKRAHTSGGVYGGGGNTVVSGFTDTSYFITFQLENGQRIELCVPANHYGLLVEQDFGVLTHQSVRFISFERR